MELYLEDFAANNLDHISMFLFPISYALYATYTFSR